MRLFEVLIPPPLLFMATAIAMFFLARSGFTVIEEGALRWTLVGACLLLGLRFGGPAISAFRRARTTISPVAVDEASSLVTDGVFGWTRNPMYVSLTLLLTAWAINLGTAEAILGPAFFLLWITFFQIVPEERALVRKFGSHYLQYRQRVRRWI